MNKVGKLIDLENVKTDINVIEYNSYKAKDKIWENYKTLSFAVEGDINKDTFSFNFDLNCKLQALLELETGIFFDLKDYTDYNDAIIIINDITYLDSINYNAKICKWLNNKFIITIHFFLTGDDVYSGILEIEFNLDDYL